MIGMAVCLVGITVLHVLDDVMDRVDQVDKAVRELRSELAERQMLVAPESDEVPDFGNDIPQVVLPEMSREIDEEWNRYCREELQTECLTPGAGRKDEGKK